MTPLIQEIVPEDMKLFGGREYLSSATYNSMISEPNIFANLIDSLTAMSYTSKSHREGQELSNIFLHHLSHSKK